MSSVPSPPTPDFAAQLKSRLDQLSSYISTEHNHPSLSLEVLLDSFLALYNDCKSATATNEHISGFITKYDNVIGKLQTLRVNTKDFDIVKTLATGAVGKVCLVKSKRIPGVYAMKILKKSDLLTRREAAFFMEERNALVFSQKSPWITTLYAAFQDEENLYLVMEYVSGGSLRSLLNNKDCGVPEDEARFYISELVVALDELHKHSFIHRDVKPENCLIDASGHLKLADFGSCIRVSESSRVTSHETVGTPDYISPEILRAQEGKADYGFGCDWWSVGIILFELIYDEVPFYSESLLETYSKIMEHEKHFAFPEEPEPSEDCRDLIKKLVCKQEARLGKNGTIELKQHHWFNSIDWENIRSGAPPFIPQLSGPEDTRYFEDEDMESKKFVKKALARSKEFSGQSLPFVGYTYLQNATGQILFSGNSTNPSAGASTGPKLFSAGSDELQQLLNQEKQKVNSLTASKKTLEDEAATLKANLARETTSRTETSNALSTVENQKIKLESELKQLRLSFERESHERAELEEKLSQMKKSLRVEAQSKAETQELIEIRKRLEAEVETLNLTLRTQKMEAMKRELAIEELSSAKSKADYEVERLEKSLDEERRQKLDLTAELDDMSKKGDIDAAKVRETEKKIRQIEHEKQKFESELKASKDALESEAAKARQAILARGELEKTKAFLDIELEAVKRKLSELTVENQNLQNKIKDAQLTQERTSNEELLSLKATIDSMILEKNANSDQIESLLKAKTVLEMEIDETKKALAHEVTAHQEAVQKGELLQESLNQEIQKSLSLEESRQQIEADLAKNETELMKTAAALTESQERIKQLTESLSKAHQDTATITKELSELKVKFELETQQSAALKKKVGDLQESVSKELKARVGMEMQYHAAEQTITQLSDDIDRLRARIDIIIGEHEQAITEHEMIVTALKAETKFLEDRLNAESDARFKAEDAKATASRWVAELEEDLKRETDVRNKTEALLDQSNKLRIQLENDLENERIRVQFLNDKIVDYEHTQDVLQAKIDIFEERDKELTAKLEAEKAQQKQGFKLKAMFFKSSRDNLDDRLSPKTMELPTHSIAQDESSLERDELQRKSSVEHSQSGIKSLTAMMHPSARSFDLSLHETFNPIDGLQGWLKVPKGGKVKKGWKLQYGLVKDYKLYIFERDKDIETLILGTVFADLTVDIFLAKAVTQNELIHASGKDIDCIFKVQAASSSKGTSALSNQAEIKARIEKLQADIELEEKMQQAHEKILNVTTDAHKVTVIAQIDASNKRIRAIRHEIEKHQSPQYKSEEDLKAVESSDGSPSEAMLLEEQQTLKKDLELQLEDELKKKEALNKVHVPESKKKSKESASTSKDLEIELMLTDRVIAKIKDGLEILNSGDSEKIRIFISKMKKKKEEDVLGHLFVPREFYKPTDCAQCHEPLWDTKNHGFECSSCKMICHKVCKGAVDVSCQDVIRLRTVPPVYFMAKDIADRSRWLQGLAHFRREYERLQSANLISSGPGGSTSSPAKDKRFSTFVENHTPHASPNSKRVSMGVTPFGMRPLSRG